MKRLSSLLAACAFLMLPAYCGNLLQQSKATHLSAHSVRLAVCFASADGIKLWISDLLFPDLIAFLSNSFFPLLSLRTFLLDAIDSIIPLETRVDVVRVTRVAVTADLIVSETVSFLGSCSGRIACLWPAASAVRALTTCCSKFHADSLSGMSEVQLDHRPPRGVERSRFRVPALCPRL